MIDIEDESGVTVSTRDLIARGHSLTLFLIFWSCLPVHVWITGNVSATRIAGSRLDSWRETTALKFLSRIYALNPHPSPFRAKT